ncbi:acyl-CoA thioester hydrolase [Saccharopolyspora kobensis]|uniref:Acyl-CoA thioester hydrolase n=1 Tax=Saccharopolyspora kobensis TaxID=146035 RepID=A0A1H5UWQ9_9PSEU|nr:acyl-CoA thioesterase [Saccharopolyspora kobensis]SEF79394.1 acyl-CoA thioester hydrolase [Saccharopolyspora kobensis]SFC68200.1 acyl-CoA thioester hydrolase [Saccharopolyspora kobensis]
MSDLFRVRVVVRGYELDTLGHLNQGVYHLYAEHARWELSRAAGITQDVFIESGAGPVYLENTIKFRNELRGGDEVDISCEFIWGEKKTFEVRQEITRADGVLAAELTSTAGVIDLQKRKLVDDPAAHFRKLATKPELLGLTG